jgi:tetratricopeptide (TPR) repeat protein
LNKDFDLAIRAYSSAISINSNFVEAYSSRGAVYGLKGQYDRAIEDFNKAIAIDPNFALAYYGRGNIYYNQGQYSQAIEDFHKAIAINPNYVDAYYNRGTAYLKIDAYDHALADIRTAARLGDKKAQAYLEDLEKKEISSTPVRNVKSLPPAPPSAIANEREVRQFFESYVKRYNLKDLEGIISSFSAKAIQNQRDDLGRIRKSYETFFEQMETIQYRITINKIEPQQNSIEVRGQYQLEGLVLIRRKKINWNGQIRWVLVRENGYLKILSLDYQPESSK